MKGMTGAMSKKLRANWRIGLLSVVLVISVILSGLVWVMPYRYEHPNEATAPRVTSVATMAQENLYVPTTVVKTGPDREQHLLFNQPQNVVLTARESIRKWTLQKGKQVSADNPTAYREYLRQSNALVLSYPSAVAITTFNTTFNQKLSAKDLTLVNRIVIPLTGQARIYLLRDQGTVVYRYQVNAQRLTKLKASLLGGRRLPVEYRWLNNQLVLTYPHAITLPTYRAAIEQQNVDSLAQTLLNSAKGKRLAQRVEGNQRIYHNGSDKRLVYDQAQGTLTFENYLSQPTRYSLQTVYAHFFRRLQQTGIIQDQLQFDTFDHAKQQITYRTTIEGFPVYNEDNYGTVRLRESETGVESLRFSCYSLTTPLPTKQPALTLPATAVVFNGLQAVGKLKDVQGLRLGYWWHSDPTAKEVTVRPTYLVKYKGEWVPYQTLMHEGGQPA